MKRIFILLLVLLGLGTGMFAQKTVVVTGSLDVALSNKKVWVKYYGSTLFCYHPDSTLTNTSGQYTLNFIIDTTCYSGAIYVETLDCIGDTIYNYGGYYTPSWNIDTLVVNFEYCDTCRYLQPDFVPAIQSQYVHFNNTSSYSSHNTYTWDFGDATANTYTGNTDHTYAALGTYTACLYVEDTVRGCRDTMCKPIAITQKNRPDSIFIKGYVSSAINGTAWVEFAGYPSSCNTGGSTTITGGLINYSLPMASCHFGQITTKMLDCDGDTLVDVQYYDTTRSSDTFYVNFDYCDSCKNFRADFNYTISGDTVTFTGYADSSANAFYWEFDFYNPSLTSTAKNPVHVYPSYGWYSVKFTARDTITGCIDSIRMWVTINPPSMLKDLWGMVYADSAVAADTFKVWLITVQIDSARGNDTLLTAVDSLTSSNGFYHFTNVNNGIYLIKAALEPSSSYYSTRMPTYYTASTQWNSATPVVVTTSLSNLYINLVAGSNPGGSGFIGGYVSVGANKTGDPIEKIQVMLYTAAGEAVAFTYTDANGEYKFTNLAFGTYKVHVEILGKPCEEYLVTLDANNPTATDKSFDVNTKGITKKTTATGIVTVKKAILALYPNPATNKINIQFESGTAHTTTIQIADMAGRVLISNPYTAQAGANVVELDVQNLTNGVYFVSVNTLGIQYITTLSVNK